MKSRIKAFLERVSGQTVWIDRATPRQQVLSAIALLQPKNPRSGLIRIGAKGDGGYLVPNDLDGIAGCISPGVSQEVGFDTALAERGVDVIMADSSVDAPPVDHPRFRFFKKHLDIIEDDAHVRLDTLCSNIPSDAGDLVLQMDIEGAEWRVLLDLDPQTLARFRIMVIEFHAVSDIFGRASSEMIISTFRKLTHQHHVVHIHPNNTRGPIVSGSIAVPPFIEVTFYRKDRPLSGEPVVIPHPLDADCVPSMPTVTLPKVWYSQH